MGQSTTSAVYCRLESLACASKKLRRTGSRERAKALLSVSCGSVGSIEIYSTRLSSCPGRCERGGLTELMVATQTPTQADSVPTDSAR